MVSVAEALALGTRHHQAGQLAEAERIYRQILAVEPDHAHALHLLGLLALQARQFQVAIELIGQAIHADRSQAAFHANLGEAHRHAGNLEQAISCYRSALRLQPELTSAHIYLGIVLHQQGNLSAAAECFREVVRTRPDDPQARANLGRVLFDQGKLPEAETCFRRALRGTPDDARAHFNLGSVLQSAGKLDEARDCYRRCIDLKGDDAHVHLNLGIILAAQNARAEAESHYRKVLAIDPRSAAAHNNLGTLYQAEGRLDQACEAFRAALQIEPRLVHARNSLGAVLQQQCKLDEADACFQEALRLDPQSPEAHNNLGLLGKARRRFDSAVASFEQALRIAPNDCDVHLNLGATLGDQGLVDEGIAHCRKAIELNPRSAPAYNNVGTLLQVLGQLDEAIASYRKSVELNPADAGAHSNLLYALNYRPSNNPQAIFAEHRVWARRHADPLSAQSPPHANDRTPGRRLRICYVSPFFLGHAVNSFVEPILMAHDRAACEVFCYADVARGDKTTEKLRGFASQWRDIAGQSDADVAELVRRDQIDIMVDLTGHIHAGSRLLLFARKPAPLQVTYIGYQNTTGMLAMDYRLTDDFADPPGTTDRYYTEQLVRLPRAFFCYLAPDEAPALDSPPIIDNRFVTFGSFNNFAKVTSEVLATWSRILLAVPRSRLLVLAPEAASLREYVLGTFGRHGVSAERIELAPRRPYEQYLRLIQRADIALDAFPFNGHTTTCDALWMGVPVIMLAGQTYASRFGGSALVNLGLHDFIATAPAEYIERATALAADTARLRELRASLRNRMLDSPLLDAPGFTRNLEGAYRRMWENWCARRPA